VNKKLGGELLSRKRRRKKSEVGVEKDNAE
jgi:hypothetical protein